MALSQSAVSDLLDALRVGEGTDLVRELAEWALQQLIEAEATEKIGAGPYERSDQRSKERHGHRSLSLRRRCHDDRRCTTGKGPQGSCAHTVGPCGRAAP